MIEDLLLLIQSNLGIALICFCIAGWFLKLHAKNQKLEFEKHIANKASKEDIEELKEIIHKQDLRITSLEK